MQRKPNQEELRAQEYLYSLGYRDIEYEPIGNVTPDFVIDNTIAIEVRRLNRNCIKDEHLVSLEDFNASTTQSSQSQDTEWLVDELQRNIQLIIEEKDNKIEQNFTLYKEWWLILVDFISFGEDKKIFEALENVHFKKYKFSKVIIIAPDNHFHVHEF